MSPGDLTLFAMLLDKLGGRVEVGMHEFMDTNLEAMRGNIRISQEEDRINDKIIFKVLRRPETVDGEVVEEEVRAVGPGRVAEVG